MAEHEPTEFHDCAVCGRTLLIGERSWKYVAPAGGRQTVCTLCKSRAESSGWVPEALAGSTAWPVQRPRARRFPLRDRGGARAIAAAVRGRSRVAPPPADEPRAVDEREEDELAARFAAIAEQAREKAPEKVEEAAQLAPDGEPRHHAVRVSDSPEALSEQQVLSRAVRVFNGSDAARQVGGLQKTLGTPRASVRQADDARDGAVIVVAWELSWYEWEVEAGHGEAAVSELRKGTELAEIGDPGPPWNASLDEKGRLRLEPV